MPSTIKYRVKFIVFAKNTYYFNLKATNGQVIGSSEMYSSESARENGIESIKKNAPEAEVVEQLD